MTPVPDDAAAPAAGAARTPARRGGRVARNRQRRTDEFLRAGLRIVTEEGFEALTMGRLSTELDTAVGAVYNYFPSKGHLVTAIQAGAIERLTSSYDSSVGPVAAAVAEATGDDPALVQLVVVGRWFCAAAETLAEEVRLLQMINARSRTALNDDGGDVLLPSTMELLERIAGAIEAAQSTGAIRPAPALARTVAWASALGGALAADDLGRYLPGIAGAGQLARQLNADLCVGWGAALDAVERIDRAVDDAARSIPLARRLSPG
jgi:AcrR family transcriptional regulator